MVFLMLVACDLYMICLCLYACIFAGSSPNVAGLFVSALIIALISLLRSGGL
jgi:hypothetical protein